MEKELIRNFFEDAPSNDININQVSYKHASKTHATSSNSKHTLPSEIVEKVRKYLLDNYQPLLQKSLLSEESRLQLQAVIDDYITKGEVVVDGYAADKLLKAMVDAIAGLGPIQPLADDENITEIMINGKDKVYIEQSGKDTLTDIKFNSNEELREIAMKIVNAAGEMLTTAKPFADCKFPQMRIHIDGDDISGLGIAITIRKFTKQLRISEETMLQTGQATKEMLGLLEAIMVGKSNVLVVGPTGSGKTELIKYLCSFIPDNQRTLVLEDTAELNLHLLFPHKHFLPMECRPTADKETTVDFGVLLKNALRQKPVRILVGEVRGVEAVLMLEILNTGHPGLCSAHSNTAKDAVERMIMMCLRSGMKLGREDIGKWVTGVFDFVILQEKGEDGVRRISEIIELEDFENGNVVVNPLYHFEETEIIEENGEVVQIHGKHVQDGYLSKKAVREFKRNFVKSELYEALIDPNEVK